jgi:hypothetical protein
MTFVERIEKREATLLRPALGLAQLDCNRTRPARRGGLQDGVDGSLRSRLQLAPPIQLRLRFAPPIRRRP